MPRASPNHVEYVVSLSVPCNRAEISVQSESAVSSIGGSTPGCCSSRDLHGGKERPSIAASPGPGQACICPEKSALLQELSSVHTALHRCGQLPPPCTLPRVLLA